MLWLAGLEASSRGRDEGLRDEAWRMDDGRRTDGIKHRRLERCVQYSQLCSVLSSPSVPGRPSPLLASHTSPFIQPTPTHPSPHTFSDPPVTLSFGFTRTATGRRHHVPFLNPNTFARFLGSVCQRSVRQAHRPAPACKAASSPLTFTHTLLLAPPAAAAAAAPSPPTHTHDCAHCTHILRPRIPVTPRYPARRRHKRESSRAADRRVTAGGYRGRLWQ